jgi:hypothetical protein
MKKLKYAVKPDAHRQTGTPADPWTKHNRDRFGVVHQCPEGLSYKAGIRADNKKVRYQYRKRVI